LFFLHASFVFKWNNLQTTRHLKSVQFGSLILLESIVCCVYKFYISVLFTILPAKDSSGRQQGAIDQGDNSRSCFDKGGVTELEQLLKQKSFTR
jgi:hypothetical protein